MFKAEQQRQIRLISGCIGILLVLLLPTCGFAIADLPAYLESCPSAPDLLGPESSNSQPLNPRSLNPRPLNPRPQQTIVHIHSVESLQTAIHNLKPFTTLILAPGSYHLTNTLIIRQDHVTIRGEKNDCTSTLLIGPGMNTPTVNSMHHGIWTSASHLTIAYLTLRDVYQHTIQFSPEANAPLVYHVKLINSGEQFIKSDPKSYGNGVNNGRVAYSIMAYTKGPPTEDHGGGSGYTNGVDLHAGRDWVIENNIFYGFHTPNSSEHLWNPAVLAWNGARGTVTRNNRFIDVDRAIAYGLTDRRTTTNAKAPASPEITTDHFGGKIVNNMVRLRPKMFSFFRHYQSDASIVVRDSPNTLIAHNTILNNANHHFAIEARFNASGIIIKNNVSDAPFQAQLLSGSPPLIKNNFYRAIPDFFVSPSTADLHLKPTTSLWYEPVPRLPTVPLDIDGDPRTNVYVAPGADEP